MYFMMAESNLESRYRKFPFKGSFNCVINKHRIVDDLMFPGLIVRKKVKPKKHFQNYKFEKG